MKIKKIFSVLTSPLRSLKKSVTAGIGVDQQKEIIDISKVNAGRLRQHFINIKKNRDPNALGAPDMTNFEEVLRHWDVGRGDLKYVIRGMVIQLLIFGLLGCYGFYLLGTSHNIFLIIQGWILFVLGLCVFILRSWKVQILCNEKFVFFKDWILFGLFSTKRKV